MESQGFQCCLPSLCFYSRYGGQSSATVCSERVWGHIWWCHRQYESLTNWSQMPSTLALDVSLCKLRETTRTIATDSLLQGFKGRVVSHSFRGISCINWISRHKTHFQILWCVHSITQIFWRLWMFASLPFCTIVYLPFYFGCSMCHCLSWKSLVIYSLLCSTLPWGPDQPVGFILRKWLYIWLYTVRFAYFFKTSLL